jgi:hypothetical protein
MGPSSYDVQNVIDILKRTPEVLVLVVEGLSEDLLRSSEDEDTFSPADVVGHLAYVDEVPWRARLTCFRDEGDERVLPGVDRFAFRERYRNRSIAEQLEIFARSRSDNLAILRDLIDRDALEDEAQHPEFGAHLNQIKRVVAKQFRDAVGPWRRYLRILES